MSSMMILRFAIIPGMALVLMAAGTDVPTDKGGQQKSVNEKADVPLTAGHKRICNDLYMPVCAEDTSGVARTYTNSCEALNAGARILANGPCLQRKKP